MASGKLARALNFNPVALTRLPDKLESSATCGVSRIRTIAAARVSIDLVWQGDPQTHDRMQQRRCGTGFRRYQPA